jgi:membrane associated rhomboid family serine protease
MLQRSLKEEVKHYYNYGGSIAKIVVIAVAVFVLQLLVWFVGDLVLKTGMGTLIISFFQMPSGLHQFIKQPWSVFTYIWLHKDPFHLIFNLLGIYWFGSVLKDLIGDAKVLPIFLLGGIFGGVFYFLLSDLLFHGIFLKGTFLLMGASGGVMALLGAAATLAPNYGFNLLFFGNVKLRWIAFVYVILNIFSIINTDNLGGSLAHIGGFLFGSLFIIGLQTGRDLSKPFYATTDFFEQLFTKKPKMKVVPKEKKATNYTETKKVNEMVNQEKIDQILDKISKSGYDSLTKAERDFLFNASNKK